MRPSKQSNPNASAHSAERCSTSKANKLPYVPCWTSFLLRKVAHNGAWFFAAPPSALTQQITPSLKRPWASTLSARWEDHKLTFVQDTGKQEARKQRSLRARLLYPGDVDSKAPLAHPNPIAPTLTRSEILIGKSAGRVAAEELDIISRRQPVTSAMALPRTKATDLIPCILNRREARF